MIFSLHSVGVRVFLHILFEEEFCDGRWQSAWFLEPPRGASTAAFRREPLLCGSRVSARGGTFSVLGFCMRGVFCVGVFCEEGFCEGVLCWAQSRR